MFNDPLEQSLGEKMLLISIIGTLEAVKEGKMSIDEAEKFLFSPRMLRKLKEKHYDEKIIYIIELGCELEDIASLLPEKLLQSIEDLKVQALNIMEDYQEIDKKFWL